MRYYFSMMDQSLFMQGENYRNLPTTYLILILPTDPLGLDQYRYDTTWAPRDSSMIHYILVKNSFCLMQVEQKGKSRHVYTNSSI